MVGVPGRSKACATCRIRKKGCDFQRPGCKRCYQAGLECGGYERERIFIHTIANRHPSALVPSSSPIVFNSVDAGKYPYLQSRRGTRPDAPDITLPASLACSALQDHYLGHFWHAYLPNGRAFPDSAAEYASGAWTNVARDLSTDNQVLKRALLANALSSLRQRTGSPSKTEVFEVYDVAINSLRRSLSNRSTATSVASLTAIRLMLMYSITNGEKPTGDGGWSFHSSGIFSMMQRRGPLAYSTGDAHQIFADFRLPTIIASIRTRKRCPLSRPEWKTKPWTGREKLPKDRLIDILADVPGLLEAVDHLRDREDEQAARAPREALAQRCLKLDRQLDAWHEHYAPTARYDMVVHAVGQPVTADDLSVVYIMSVAWAAAILLHSILRGLGANPDRLPKQSRIRMYLREIAKCTYCFLNPNMGVFGMEMAVFPLGLALQFLADPSADSEPMHEERCMFRDISKLKGGERIISALTSLRQDSGIPESPTGGDSTETPGKKQWVGAWPFLDKRRETQPGEASTGGALQLRTRT